MRISSFTIILLLICPAILYSDIKKCSQNKISDEEIAQGFVPLFDGKSLEGWVGLNGSTDSYYVKDGMLICKKTGREHIFTKDEYDNFILRLQVKMDPGANNGVGIRARKHKIPHIYGMEIQILDDDYYADGDPIKLLDYQHHGSLYGVVPAKTGCLKPAGQWNDEEIICDGRRVKVTLNGTVIVDADLDKSKPVDKHEHPGLTYKKGLIGLLAHGNYGAEVFFRNIRVKTLDHAPALAEKLKCEYLTDPIAIDTPRPRLFWRMNDKRRGAKQTAYQVMIASSKKNLDVDKGDLWDSGRVESDCSAHIQYDGRPLASGETCFWKVRVWDKDDQASAWSEPATWSMGLLQREDWQASWVRSPDIPASESDNKKPAAVWSPWMRKTFQLENTPQQARAYINVMGFFELYVNGKKVGTDVLSPAVSDFSKRSFYVTCDIAPYLRNGNNCIALWLGQGWRFSRIRGVKRDGAMARAQFDIKLDGKSVRIVTDETWKTHPSSRSLIGKWFWNEFGGERLDARLHDASWNLAEYDDSNWKNVEVVVPPETRTESQLCPLNRVGQHIAAVKCDEWGKGEYYVLDFGTNLTGWLRLKLPKLPAGHLVRIHYADDIRNSLDPEETPGGLLKPTNSDKVFEYQGGKTRAQTFNQLDEFISAGRDTEEFCSKFNFHGFRYAIVEGLPSKPALNDAEALLIESDLRPVGSFACSNQLLNRIFQLNLWTVRCLNQGGYMVDCPHRERVGYGDGQVSVETCMMNLYMPNFYEKWLSDWLDSQDAKSGELPHVAPHMPGGGGPGWGGTAAALAWRMYLYYGDRKVLEKSYASHKGYVDYLESFCKDDIIRVFGGKWDFLGDWVPPRHGMDSGNWQLGRASEAFNNCYRVYLWEHLRKMAVAMDRKEEAARCQTKIDSIRPLIHNEFFVPEKLTYVLDGQTYRAFPLYTDIVPDTHRKAVSNALHDSILVHQKGHLDTGMLGTYFLIQYLQQADRNDLVYEIATQEDYPGWGYMLARGATTMWEQWNGHWSQIHSCFTSIGGWFSQGIAGIQPDVSSPGFKSFVIKPSLVGNLTWVRADYESLHGRIESNWQLQSGKFSLDIVVPANTTAIVHIPTIDADSITEGGLPASSKSTIKFLHTKNGCAVYKVDSGRYHFISKNVSARVGHAPKACR